MNEVQLLLENKVVDFEAPGVPIKIDNWAPCTNAEDRVEKGVVKLLRMLMVFLGILTQVSLLKVNIGSIADSQI